MLVKDIIADSKFSSADGFNDLKPEITVILPTYRRGDNGLLSRAINSIVNQTFTNFELIIIDDASVDSTSDIIKYFIKKDVRVACIRHKTNIALPAISVNEGILKARANKVFFAFDDTVIVNNALEVLYNFHKQNPDCKMCYGQSKLYYKENKFLLLPAQKIDSDTLQTINRISNSAILIDKSVFEDVGLYDPNPLLIRLCDWDLWRRIDVYHQMYFVHFIVSEEYGVTQDDSLGNTFNMNVDCILEYMSTNPFKRNEALKPNNFFNYNIATGYEKLSSVSSIQMDDILTINSSKIKLDALKIKDNEDSGYILVIHEGISASLELYFNSNVENKLKSNIVYIHWNSPFLLKMIINAKTIIFVRSVDYYVGLLCFSFILKNHIPYYIFLDDNFFELFPDKYKTRSMYDVFLKARGVLLTSDALIEYFKKEKIHDTIFKLDVALDTDVLNKNIFNTEHFNNIKELKIAYLSGAHRESGFFKKIEQIKTLSKKVPIKLILYSINPSFLENVKNAVAGHDIKVKTSFYNQRFNQVLRDIKEEGVHFIIHSSGNNQNDLKNYPYKTKHFLAYAYLTSSVLIVDKSPPYEDLLDIKSNLSKTVLSENNNFLKMINDFINNKNDILKKYSKDLYDYCKLHYDPNLNAEVIGEIERAHKSPSLFRYLTLLNNMYDHNSTFNKTTTNPIMQKPNLKNLKKTIKATFKYYMNKHILKKL